MIGPACELPDLVDRIRSKFGIRRRFKCKIRDEDGGEMITLSDQDDLDMAILACKASAKREASEMGKMEVSFTLGYVVYSGIMLTGGYSCGFRKLNKSGMKFERGGDGDEGCWTIHKACGGISRDIRFCIHIPLSAIRDGILMQGREETRGM